MTIQKELETFEIQAGLMDGMEARPTVSIIIPAYNAANHLNEALDSVFRQSFSSYEVIVINDGSPDTEELERTLDLHQGRFHYLKQDNRGAAAARNAGLRLARGEFVAFLDADDKWRPDFLESQLDFLRHSNADLVYSDALLFGESPLAGRSFMEVQPSRGAVTPESLLALNVTVLTSSVLARKAPVLEVGLFDESLRRGHDFELWLRLAKAGFKLAYQRKILVDHRKLESSLSGDVISQLHRTLNVLEALKVRGHLTESENAALEVNQKRTLRELALESGKEKLANKDFTGARRFFGEALKFKSSWKLLAVCLSLRIAPNLLWQIYHRRFMTQ